MIPFPSPQAMAEWLVRVVFNDMDRAERRWWVLAIVLITAGLYGSIRADGEQR